MLSQDLSQKHPVTLEVYPSNFQGPFSQILSGSRDVLQQYGGHQVLLLDSLGPLMDWVLRLVLRVVLVSQKWAMKDQGSLLLLT